MKADPAAQRRLLDLAGVDAELSRADHRRRTLPEQVAVEEAERTLRAAADAVVVAQTSLSDLDRDVAKLDREVEQVRTRETRDRGMLANGSVSAKQATDLQHELDSLERRRAVLEEEQLEVMERQEAAGVDLQHETQAHEAAKTTLEDAVERRDGVLGDIGTLEARRGEERKGLVAELPADLVAALRPDPRQGCGRCRGAGRQPVRRLPAGDGPRRAPRHPGRRAGRGGALRQLRRHRRPHGQVDGHVVTGTADAAGAWTGRGAAIPTRVLLLRHGQSPLSVDRRYSGRGNPALTEVGQAQAEAAASSVAARYPAASVVVTSPLDRARSTSAPVAARLGVGVEVDAGFTETDFGAWEGLTFREAADRDPEVHRSWLGDTAVAPPGGESFDDVGVRVSAALQGLVTRYAGSTIVLVSHVTPIKTILRIALDAGPSLLYRLHLDLACLSVVDFWDDGGASVRLVNDTSYLR